MDKVVLFGAGQTGRYIYEKIKGEYDVIAFVDSNRELRNKSLYGLPIKEPDELLDLEYDFIIIACLTDYEEIKGQLLQMGIRNYKINSNYVSFPTEGRISFLEKFAGEIYENELEGNVAEVGVYKGDFSKHINRCFPDRKLYLFDTFDGFSKKDIEVEQEYGLSKAVSHSFKNDDIKLVLQKLPFREAGIEVKKGYFPQTAEGIDDKFCFVNLDVDLYLPTYEGLAFFYPKMSMGGVILIHDYYSFSIKWNGVKKAVRDYEKNMGIKLVKVPIGDGMSLAVLKVLENSELMLSQSS